MSSESVYSIQVFSIELGLTRSEVKIQNYKLTNGNPDPRKSENLENKLHKISIIPTHTQRERGVHFGTNKTKLQNSEVSYSGSEEAHKSLRY